ncbi:exodeoxyribonuclease VII large subunit [bacterium]|nr:exodeoxyribonuclease VII large subunit [bacterium]
MVNNPYIYTISEITSKIKLILEGNLHNIRVMGEISNLVIHASGHVYLTLKDNYSQIKMVIFRSKANLLRFNLQDGLMIIAHGEISVYEKRGEYQLIADHIEPAGYGELYLAFEQLKEQLRIEGLFSEAHKKPLPMVPNRIGIITSPTGAAVQDILNIITRRFSNIEILIYPVMVQGETAPSDIANAISQMNRLPDTLLPDVLIVGRGGGSIEDLWAFNDERVARAIFDSDIPIISAVGHECDFTIADFVADLRAPTPSAAAELVVKNKRELVERIEVLSIRLRHAIQKDLDLIAHRLKRLKESSALLRADYTVLQYQQRVDEITLALSLSVSNLTKLTLARLETITGKLNTLNPSAILSRGYSITFKLPEETVINNANQVKKEDRIRIHLHKGEVIAEIRDIGEECTQINQV